MNAAIESRELITLDSLQIPVHGTYHKAHRRHIEAHAALSKGLDLQARRKEPDAVGVLFLNSLALPRSWAGDSAVYWADAFAACGYPCFRFDLPGVGDSEGTIPMDLLDYINAGSYAPVASAKVKELVERFGLSGVVIVGHCAGAVSALYSAAASDCRGLILMDPYFHLPPKVRRSRVWKRLGRWASRNSFVGFLSNLGDRLKDIYLLLRGNAPPSNANRPLLARWKELASAGLPILLLKAPGRKTPGTKPRTGDFDYLSYVQELAGRGSRVAVQLIEGTDHSFANASGRTAVRQCTVNWLRTYFPIEDCEEPTVHTMSSKSGNTENNSERYLNHERPLST